MDVTCPSCGSIDTDYYGEHEDYNASWFTCNTCGQLFLEENKEDADES